MKVLNPQRTFRDVQINDFLVCQYRRPTTHTKRCIEWLATGEGKTQQLQFQFDRRLWRYKCAHNTPWQLISERAAHVMLFNWISGCQMAHYDAENELEILCRHGKWAVKINPLIIAMELKHAALMMGMQGMVQHAR